MARIAEEDINNIRSNADIVSIIGSYIKLEAKGKNYFGICPFHNDHNPSMSVSPDKQIYYLLPITCLFPLFFYIC